MPTSRDDPKATFDWPVRIYYEDTDAAGVVFYANYLRFLERGRSEWLRALGYEQDALRRDEGILFTVRRVELDYRTSAVFNDLLTVRSGLAHIGGASLTFAQEILRDADGALCCQGAVNVACIDAGTLRPRRLPVALVTGILAGTGRSSPASME
ncbi:tol-pal system-associated acyl-CoA thioesterase [uncultured Thiocystis sp.]|jgi:acyl-CoA thioester hydrolase|uniref:tol-pal system-associated acyl-CoA thioesterase n=1 Tax=uncultured Thiocystis sp. TaxID=1202134 RepID=UPI0025D2FD9F|nr:tol-pal system-associated acyl-CoA thioesterase [uncultured Thiocystis sp.]